ncbi:hypothetical protein NDR87_22185 [Nocardia sp. CDC159]|uniref:Uncharacterized protein n=1 Tax=Nocardia pulmonis TaxID=2951408 RepID=A0A9X2J069_9NOCA|nr:MULTISPECIES: hypothetical protein [Nocardia]MCM6776770.1 hypothetical protein [Nocardia pulmonis]MCM6789081.1 hypothetical protein [Nocardia sp. CDC159]
MTKVVVYAVGDAGATGGFLGVATLLEPEYALVHPPLNRALADASRALRVGVFDAERDIGEVIDVARVRVIPDDPELVLLELAFGSTAPVRGVPLELPDDPLNFEQFLEPSDAEIVAGVRRVFDEIPPPHEPTFEELIAEAESGGGTPADDPIRWLAKLFGGG